MREAPSLPVSQVGSPISLETHWAARATTRPRVMTLAAQCVSNEIGEPTWLTGKDGASLIARLLFEEATNVNFYVGRAMNPAHQNPDLPLSLNLKLRLVEELARCLEQMDKAVAVRYY